MAREPADEAFEFAGHDGVDGVKPLGAVECDGGGLVLNVDEECLERWEGAEVGVDVHGDGSGGGELGCFLLDMRCDAIELDDGATMRAGPDFVLPVKRFNSEINLAFVDGGDRGDGVRLGADGRGGEVLDVDRDANGFFAGFEKGGQSVAGGVFHEVDHGGGAKDGDAACWVVGAEVDGLVGGNNRVKRCGVVDGES